MSGRGSPVRIIVGLSIFVLVVSIVGFAGTLILDSFVLDDYNSYGEVPVPGESTLHLPAGEVKISFHTEIAGSTSGGGLPVPDLSLTIGPPQGVAQPQVTDDVGGTTSVNNDVHRRVWTAQIPVDGNYDIKTDGKVSPFINPTLAFGHDSSKGWLVWVFVGLFVVSLLTLIITPMLAGRIRRPQPPGGFQSPPMNFGNPSANIGYPPDTGYSAPPSYPGGQATPPTPTSPYSPTDNSVKIEQLKTLAALRQSGALTEAEFEVEKRRVLGS
jgi:hypothetical protein